MASVGQISMQAWHEPQWSGSGKSGGMSRVVRISQRNSQDPKRDDTRFECLPSQPMPARCAKGFSIIGAVSTKIFRSPPAVSCIHRPRRLRRFLRLFMIC